MSHLAGVHKQLRNLGFGWLIPLMTVIAGVGLYVLDPVFIQILRNTTFDHYQRWHAQTYVPGPVRVVDIDDASLKKLGQWPWPRTRIAELVNQLHASGARVIAFDVIFAEPDRTSPRAVAQDWKLGAAPALRDQLATLPDHDAVLAKTIKLGGVVLGNMPSHQPPAAGDNGVLGQPFSVVELGPSALPFLHGFTSSITALPAFLAAAAGNGAIAFVPDADGVVRRVPLLMRIGDQVVPSLAAETLRVMQASEDYLVTTSDEAGAGIAELMIGDMTLPTTSAGEMWVRYVQHSEARYIPAWKVLEGRVEAGELRDKLVLIGTSAEGLRDLRFSPLGKVMPGVEVHAQVIEQALRGVSLMRPNWAPGLEVLVMVVSGLTVGFIAVYAGALASAVATGIILAMTIWGGWSVYTQANLLLDPSIPGVVMLVAFVLGSLHHHMVSERRQRWVRQAFARYVSPNLVQHLVDSPGALELGGHRRECSFIFTDLAGFTTLMEKLDPAEAVGLLNIYLDNMIRIAFEHEGTLDRIVGDAVAIMFSAPVEQTDHRQRALRCAEAMHHFSLQYAQDAQARNIPWGVTRIGIHTGEVTVGNFGGSTIFDYRALGDPVNTASRLESVNKQLGTLVCVSEAALKGNAAAEVRPVGKLVLKGKSEPLKVYEPRFAARLDLPWPDAEYLAAYEAMAREAPEAQAAMAALVAARPNDPLPAFHHARLTAGQSGEVIVFTSK